MWLPTRSLTPAMGVEQPAFRIRCSRGLFVIAVREPGSERLGALDRGAVATCLHPLPNPVLGESLGLAVGLGPIRPGEAVLGTQRTAGIDKRTESLARSVLGQDTLDRDSSCAKPSGGPAAVVAGGLASDTVAWAPETA